MTEERYREVDANLAAITEAEFEAGWHFCAEWDGLLIGPGYGELSCCTCYPIGHPVRLECRRMAKEQDFDYLGDQIPS